MPTCYAITAGSYSDYRIIAVFSNKEHAEEQMSAWGGDEVEELPFDDYAPKPPDGMQAYTIQRWVKTFAEIDKGRLRAFTVDCCDMRNEPSKVVPVFYGFQKTLLRLETKAWAKDEQHAIKIAAERFAQYDAI